MHSEIPGEPGLEVKHGPPSEPSVRSHPSPKQQPATNAAAVAQPAQAAAPLHDTKYDSSGPSLEALRDNSGEFSTPLQNHGGVFSSTSHTQEAGRSRQPSPQPSGGEQACAPAPRPIQSKLRPVTLELMAGSGGVSKALARIGYTPIGVVRRFNKHTLRFPCWTLTWLSSHRKVLCGA